MLLINFSHPIDATQQAKIETLIEDTVTIVDISTQLDRTQDFTTQIVALVDAVGLAPRDWQTTPLLINPPGLAMVMAGLLAEIHGRAGYFVPIILLRPIPGVVPPRFEPYEVVNLNAMREAARQRRF
jgi:hypothetical protein